MLSTANVVRAAMLALPSPEPAEPHAWTRQPSGTWMKAPLSVSPLRNTWTVLAGLPPPPPPLVEGPEDEDDGPRFVHSHWRFVTPC